MGGLNPPHQTQENEGESPNRMHKLLKFDASSPSTHYHRMNGCSAGGKAEWSNRIDYVR